MVHYVTKSNKDASITTCVHENIYEGDVIVIRKYNDIVHCTIIPADYGHKVSCERAIATDCIITIDDKYLKVESEKGIKSEVSRSI